MYLCKNWDHEASFSATLQWCGRKLALWNLLSVRNLSFRRVIKKGERTIRACMTITPSGACILLASSLFAGIRACPRSTRLFMISINHLISQLCKEGGVRGRAVVVMTVWMPWAGGRGQLTWHKMSSRYMCKIRWSKYTSPQICSLVLWDFLSINRYFVVSPK